MNSCTSTHLQITFTTFASKTPLIWISVNLFWIGIFCDTKIIVFSGFSRAFEKAPFLSLSCCKMLPFLAKRKEVYFFNCYSDYFSSTVFKFTAVLIVNWIFQMKQQLRWNLWLVNWRDLWHCEEVCDKLKIQACCCSYGKSLTFFLRLTLC